MAEGRSAGAVNPPCITSCSCSSLLNPGHWNIWTLLASVCVCDGGEKGLSNDSTTCWKEEVSVQSEWSFEKAGMRTYLWMMDGIFISISPLSLSLSL